MKKIQTLLVLACAASLFAQAPATPAAAAPAPAAAAPAAEQIPCRAAFNAIKDTYPRDAAANRIYATVEARVRALESVPKEDRKDLYLTEEKSCGLSVELLKTAFEKAALQKSIDSLNKANISALNELSLVKGALIEMWSNDAKGMQSMRDALNEERDRLERLNKEKEQQLAASQKALAEKDSLLAAQKAEAEKKLDALRSKTINVYKDARGTILSMSDILFETGKADLMPELKVNLAEIAAILKNLLTDSDVEIEGHTDDQGTAAFNKDLSEKRANAVLSFLVERGVEKKRLKAVGYGLTKPIANNKTADGKPNPEGMAKNRRVELVIKDK